MFETMYEAKGVGLAAPQIFVSKRLFVMDCSGGEDETQKIAIINPEIIHVEGEQTGEEGCLSFPGLYQKSSARYADNRALSRRERRFSGTRRRRINRPLCSARNRPLRRHRFSRPNDTFEKGICQTQNQKIAENGEMGIIYAADCYEYDLQLT